MKAVLREHFRARRREFSYAKGKDAAAPLNLNLRRLIDDLTVAHGPAPVCAYHATPEEAHLNIDATWFVPRVRGDDLEFRRPNAGARSTVNRFGITEPTDEDSLPLSQNLPALIVCPAVAVDWRGGRLGMGKSFYDRYFTGHPACVRIAAVYHVQVAKDPLPAEGWDEPLDWIVTEKMILRTTNRSSYTWTKR